MKVIFHQGSIFLLMGMRRNIHSFYLYSLSWPVFIKNVFWARQTWKSANLLCSHIPWMVGGVFSFKKHSGVQKSVTTSEDASILHSHLIHFITNDIVSITVWVKSWIEKYFVYSCTCCSIFSYFKFVTIIKLLFLIKFTFKSYVFDVPKTYEPNCI